MAKCLLPKQGVPWGALHRLPARRVFAVFGLTLLLSGSHCGGEGRSLRTLLPSVGSVLGGEAALLTGSGLAEPPRVLFGGTEATMLQADSSQALRLRIPPFAVRGEQRVSALWSDGQLLSLDEPFTYHALQLSTAEQAFPPTQLLAHSVRGRSGSSAASGDTVDLWLATDQPLALHRFAGRSDGHFSWQASQPLRAQATALLTVDLDGDGREDLVVAEGARQILSLWLGQADGSLSAGGEIAAGCVPESLCAADLLGDARPDLVVGCREATSLAGAVFENRWPSGAATRFAAPRPLSLPGPVAVGSVQVVAADLWGQGRATLAATLGRRGGLVLFQSDAMGNFSVAATLPTWSEPDKLLAPDLNGDGRADLVVVDRTSDTLSFYLSPASGLPTRQLFLLPPGYERPSIAAIDFDDFRRSQELVLSAPPAPGSSQPRPLQVLGLSAGEQLRPLASLPSTKDGLQLVATPLAPGAPIGLLGLSRDAKTVLSWPAPATPAVLSSGLPPPHSLVTADLTSDGHIDAAWLVDSRVALLLTDDRQGGEEAKALPAPSFLDVSSPRGAPRTLFAADLNGDWLGDLVLGDGQGLQLWLARQPAQFQPPLFVDLPLAVDVLSVADINEDGRPDVIAAAASQAALYVLLGNGNGTLQTAQRIALPGNASDGILALRSVDQDGDGQRDILALSSGQLHILRGQGGGRLAAPLSLSLPIAARSLVVPDLDFDGRRDIVLSSDREPGLVVLRAQADGSLAAAALLPSDVPLPSLVAEDLDRDGQIDVIATVAGSGELRVALGRADGSLLPPVPVAVGQPTLAKDATLLPQSFDLASLDLSLDAERDLLVLGQSAYQVLLRSPAR